jgi:TRAP transporter TAXI family solute receptor
MIKWRQKSRRDAGERLKFFGPALALTWIGFVIAYQYVAPAPPRTLSMATGSPQGAYHMTGEAYREILARDGITLELRSSAGSLENLHLLEAVSGGVDAAFVQGGLGSLAKTDDVVALGSLFYEPLWIFHRSGIALERLSDLQGLRVAVGPEGSGTKILTMKLLNLNGVDYQNSQIQSIGFEEATDSLINGEIDAAFFVANVRAQFILKLFSLSKTPLLGIERAQAYAVRFPYLHVLTLPEGVIDFKANLPARDLSLIAPTAQLVARSDLHPALVGLLLQAAEEIHHKGGGFEKEGEFPAPGQVDFRLSDEARRFYKSGPPFLQRYLPFWVADFFSRMKIMLLPMVALLYPFFKLMPPVYRWRMRSRIYRWYAKLRIIDAGIQQATSPSNAAAFLAKLDRLETDVFNVSVPLAFSEELYELRLHIDLLRKKLLKA